MVCPDPLRRITAMQAYHHPALQPAAPAVIITPHFVRAATNVEEEPLPPIPYNDVEPQVPKKKVRVKKDAVRPRSATPTALGESIKQHTSAGKPKRKAKGKGKEDVEPVEASPEKKGSKLVIKNHREHRYSETKVEEEDPTRTFCSPEHLFGLAGRWLIPLSDEDYQAGAAIARQGGCVQW